MLNKQMIVVNGLPASGKSTLANKIADRKEFIRLSSDETRFFYLGKSQFPANIKYSRFISSMIFDIIYLKAELELFNSNGVVLDGMFSFPPGWEKLKTIAEKTNSKVFFYQLIASFETLSKRIENRKNDPFCSEADLEVLKKHWEFLEKENFQYPTRNPDFLKLGFRWREILVD